MRQLMVPTGRHILILSIIATVYGIRYSLGKKYSHSLILHLAVLNNTKLASQERTRECLRSSVYRIFGTGIGNTAQQKIVFIYIYWNALACVDALNSAHTFTHSIHWKVRLNCVPRLRFCRCCYVLSITYTSVNT